MKDDINGIIVNRKKVPITGNTRFLIFTLSMLKIIICFLENIKINKVENIKNPI
jgi:hypothetical protein